MEIVKANLHMDRNKCRVNTQITLEEDKNISDRNPDAAGILLDRAEVTLDEVRPGKDMVTVRGRLTYEMLILSEEEEGLYHLQGEIPFEEKIRAEGMEAIDNVEIIPGLEDLRTGLINSRKLSVRALVHFEVKVVQIFDQEIPIGLTGGERLEVQKETVSQSVVAVDRRDILRVKEDLELPANLPPVQEILWKSMELGKWEIRPLEDSIGVQGEIRFFLLYEGEGEERPIKSYETAIPFSGNLECPGSRSTMLSEIVPSVGEWGLSVKEDYDGEARILEAEMTLNLPVHLLENRDWEILKDAYGTTQEVTPVYMPGYRKLMRDKYQGKVKVSQVFSPPASETKILQVCHTEGLLLPQEVTRTEAGLEIEGLVSVNILYMTGEEGKPYKALKGEIPYSYLFESNELTENSYWKATPSLEYCSSILLDGETIEVKIMVGLDITLGEKWQQPFLSDLQINPLLPEKINKLPGIVVYFPGQQESLWDVGKKYMVSLDSIRSLNQLSSDMLEKNQKILIVKEVN